MLLKNVRLIYTSNEILENKDVLIKGNIIEDIGTNLKADEYIDCSDKILIPGLINLHAHGGMSFLRGIEDDMELNDWLNKKIWPAEKKLTPQDIYYASLISYLESIRSGITTTVDAYFQVDEMELAASNSRIRAYLSPAIFSFQDFENYKKHKFLGTNNELVKPFVFIHSIYATDEKAIKNVNDFCNKNNIIKAIHLSETRNETIDCKNKYDLLPIQYLDSINFFDSKSLLVHCVWLTKDEIAILNKKDVAIAHCPISNMKLASGATMPLMELKNVNTGLGTDSVVSNNSLSIFSEMKQTGLLHKNHRWDPTVAKHEDILKMATVNGANALGRNDLAKIEKGCKADIVLLDANDFNLLGTDKDNLISNLVYSANTHNVVDVFIDGFQVLKNRQINFEIKDHNGNSLSLEGLRNKVSEFRKKLI